MRDRRLRLALGLLFSVDARGTHVWQPQRRERTVLDADLVSLLLRFGDGATIGDAVAAAGIELDETAEQAVAMLVDAQLLVDIDRGPVAAPRPEVARARIDELVDGGSFSATTRASIVTGRGAIGGRAVAIAAWEPGTTEGIDAVLDLQEQLLADPGPIIYVLDAMSLGHDPGDFAGPRGIGRVYANQARLSGLAPQIAIVCGSLWRPAALLPAGCDLVIFVEPHGFVHIGDRAIVKELTGEDVAQDELGGARMHAEASGLAHLVARSTADAAALVRRYLALMPASSTAPLPRRAGNAPPAMSPAALDALVPDNADRPFAIDALVAALCDEGSPLELRPAYARELSTTLARLDGVPIGVVANCSHHKAGILTVDAADKAARFVTLCDAYGIPLLFVVDVLGIAIGRAAERAGIERAAARLFAALAAAAVPKLTLVARKAHTAGLYAMCGPAFDPDAFLALPTAAISIFSERRLVRGAAGLERLLDAETRESLRGLLRSARTPPEVAAREVVAASGARDALIAHLHRALATPRPRSRRQIPP